MKWFLTIYRINKNMLFGKYISLESIILIPSFAKELYIPTLHDDYT